MEMKVRNLDSELEQHRPLASRLAKEDTFCFAMNAREMRELFRLEPRHILHMALPDDHRVPGDAAVGVERDRAVIILINECAEAGQVADCFTEAAMH